MSVARRRRSPRSWAIVAAQVALACQFPEYDLARQAAVGGQGVLTPAGSANGGGTQVEGGSQTGGGPTGGTSVAGMGATDAVGGVAGSNAGQGAQPSAGTNVGGAAGDGGSAGAAGDPNLLLSDDFETGSAAQWLEVAGSPWAIANDGQGSGYQLSPVFADFYAAAAKDGPWTDQIIDVDVKVLAFGGTSTSDVVSLLGRFGNIDNYYAAVLRPDGRVALRACLAGAAPTTLKTSPALGIAAGTWYHVRFELVGDSLRLSIDGALAVEVQDSSLAKGTLALGGDNSAALFDNVRVTLP